MVSLATTSGKLSQTQVHSLNTEYLQAVRKYEDFEVCRDGKALEDVVVVKVVKP